MKRFGPFLALAVLLSLPLVAAPIDRALFSFASSKITALFSFAGLTVDSAGGDNLTIDETGLSGAGDIDITSTAGDILLNASNGGGKTITLQTDTGAINIGAGTVDTTITATSELALNGASTTTLGGGVGSTGCTVTSTSGALACTADLTLGGDAAINGGDVTSTTDLDFLAETNVTITANTGNILIRAPDDGGHSINLETVTGTISIGSGTITTAITATDVASVNGATSTTLSGGVGSTGCTVTSSTGAFACTAAVTSPTFVGIVAKATNTISASAIDWALSATHEKTISVNTTFTFSNATDGQTIFVRITAGSDDTVTWPTVQWSGGAAPVQTLSGTDVYTFVKIGSTIYGSVIPAVS